MKIGVISDTHGLLRAEVLEMLFNVDHIIHAGDIGDVEIVPRLRAIAPTTAIRGNVDTGAWADVYPSRDTIRLANRSVHVLHDLQDLGIGEGRRRPGRVGPFAPPEDRDHRRCALSQPRQRRTAAFQIADIDGDDMQARIHEIGP